MKTDLIKIKRLETNKDLELLSRGDVVILGLGSGKICDNKEYYGLVVFMGEWNGGLNFCRPQSINYNSNYNVALVGYFLKKEWISVTKTGQIFSSDFCTYGCKNPELIKNSNLI